MIAWEKEGFAERKCQKINFSFESFPQNKLHLTKDKEKKMKKLGVICMAFLIIFGLMCCSVTLAAVKKITIWSWGESIAIEEGLIKNSWPLMEKEFGIKIEHEEFPGISEMEFVTKIVNSTRFGKGPDIIEANNIVLSTLAYEGFLQPIPSWLDKSLQEKLLLSYRKVNYLWDKDGYKKPFMGTLTGGDAGGQVLLWNKTMYALAGLPSSPKTWDEVFEYGKKLTKYADGSIERSGFFFRTGGHTGGIADKWIPYFLSAGGGSLLKLENGKIKANFNTAAGRKTVQFYLDGLYKYKIDAIGIPGDIGGWEKGQTATVSARRAWAIVHAKAHAPEMYPKLKIGSIPVSEEGMKSITTSQMGGFTVNPEISSEKKELIWKLFERLNQPDMVAKRVNDIEIPLPYKEALKKSPFDIGIWQNFVKCCRNVMSCVEAPKISVAQNILGEQLNFIFVQEKTVEEGLSAAAEEINRIYEDVSLKE